MQSGDGIVIFLILIAIAVWAFTRTRGWVRDKTRRIEPDVPVDEEIPADEAVTLLEESGYEVLAAKKRLPIQITLNGSESLQSRLFIDYFAQKDGEYYIVKLAKDRKPLELTGSGIRDAFLCYQLAYPQTAGILYVDMAARKINTIHIKLEV
ncbi:hypothetical protein [Paenibacillus hamazuiensis]|uniref:hypothetical protein n=1 Tax=Paenibacillus hamazuiensis TaxID=2936508 RepID=UPI00200D747C|nr:hypothetical protein [Paenibacillus hamazuiensis]